MTLCISDIEKYKKKMCLIYGVATFIAGLFGGIYELFSHGVYSCFMIYGFMLPFAAGLLPWLVVLGKDININNQRKNGVTIYNSGIATLTVGSILKGVLDIYGTTNTLVWVYAAVGLCLCIIGITIIIKKCR